MPLLRKAPDALKPVAAPPGVSHPRPPVEYFQTKMKGLRGAGGRAAQARFVEGNLFRHVTVMALTSSVGLMAVFVVDLINMVYISWLGRAELAAAIGYAGAMLFFTTSFGIGMSIAVSASGVAGGGGARSGGGAGEGDDGDGR